MMKDLLNKLQNPAPEYRPVPFWSWNDELEPEFLKWQVREMEKTGHGGYFMHARGGLKTDYLSDEWMACIKAGIDKGKKTGMNAWAYDEEGWPSGFAGGIVTAMGDDYHVRWMEIEDVESETFIPDDDSILGYYLHNNKDNTVKLIKCEDVLQSIKDDYRVIAIRQKKNQYYIDIFNEEVVKAFIDSTYEKYYKAFGDEFGKGLKGFFTDEPQYARCKIPWSNVLPQEFKQRYSYDIIDILPMIFMEVIGYEKARYDYWSMVNDMYVKSFGKQIYDWCEAHNCQLTGHSIQEGSIFRQMGFCAGVMPFYEYMHVPGMDWLGRAIDSPIIPKSVGSVACQLGKKLVLSETFALCGWDVSFEELKWIAQWQYVNGVNFMCQHLESYTLKGLRKRDYPASLFYHQSWWEEYRVFNDYLARLGVLLTEGRSNVRTLLLHPLKSGWIAYNWTNSPALQELDDDFEALTTFLSEHHIEHHYGDETVIANHGKIREGQFVVGECAYDLVILPTMTTIDESTLKLLESFMAVDGKVIAMGDMPSMCNGKKMESLSLKLEKAVQVKEWESILPLVEKSGMRTVRITQEDKDIPSIHIQTRDLGDSQIIYMVNHSQEVCHHAKIQIHGDGGVFRLNLEDNSQEIQKVLRENGCLLLDLTFEPMEAHVLLHERNGVFIEPADIEEQKTVNLGQDWAIEAVGHNSMTLDYCRYSIDDGAFEGPIPIIRLMDMLLRFKRRCHIDLKFNFEVSMDIERNKAFYLAVEAAEEFEILINGTPVTYDGKSWWKDSAFNKIDIKPFIQNGNNEIRLKREFYQDQKVYDVLFGENVLETEVNKLTYNTELESLYLVGDFGVVSQSDYTSGEKKAVMTDGPFIITDRPDKVKDGDLTKQGFCFLAEPITLSQQVGIDLEEGRRQMIHLISPNAAISRIYVNDKPLKALPWAPYKVDITDYVHSGPNKIAIKLYPGNRNLLGPHHHFRGELHFVGPSSFTHKPGRNDGEIDNVWRDRYCFVEFGL